MRAPWLPWKPCLRSVANCTGRSAQSGRRQYSESALSTVTTRVDGYIERLLIDYTGVEVKKGDHLVETTVRPGHRAGGTC